MLANNLEGLTNKILSKIENLAKKEKAKFETFWNNFGPVLKEGLYEHNDHHEKILPLLRFENSINKNKISLVFFTHAHEDHVGAIAFFYELFDCLIYCNEFTSYIARNKLSANGLDDKKLRIIQNSPSFKYEILFVIDLRA